MLPKADVDEALVAITQVMEKIDRVVRGAAYFIIAALLLNANPYNLQGFWTLALAIGALGLMGNSARIGQWCLAALALMALVPPSVIGTMVEITLAN